MDGPLNVAVAGVGNWGRKLLRNFTQVRRCRVRWVCDLDEEVLAKQAAAVPGANATTEFDEVLNDQVQAVIIATKAAMHYEAAAKALQAGKHVFVEKPLCLSSRDAEALVALAGEVGRKLMVGHLLLYHPCVEQLRRMIANKELGDMYYLYAQRLKGVVRQDENAWWSLAPHDVSVVCDLFQAQPIAVSAAGQSYMQRGVEDVVFAALRFADGRIAHIHVSWLDQHKIRKMTIVGTRRTVTFDDMEATEKLRVYGKGADVKEGYASFERPAALRIDDIVSRLDPHLVRKIAAVGTTRMVTFDDLEVAEKPRTCGKGAYVNESFEGFERPAALRIGERLTSRVTPAEPLKIEVQHFVDCVLDDKPIRSDGAEGLRVLRVLEAGSESIRRGGEPVSVVGVRE